MTKRIRVILEMTDMSKSQEGPLHLDTTAIVRELTPKEAIQLYQMWQNFTMWIQETLGTSLT